LRRSSRCWVPIRWPRAASAPRWSRPSDERPPVQSERAHCARAGVRARDRAVPARQADLGAGARARPRRSLGGEAGLQRKSARHRSAHARRDRRGTRRHLPLSGRQRLRAEDGARRALQRRPERDRAGQRIERRAGAGLARVSRRRALRGPVAACLRRVSARDAGARRAFDRGSRETVWPRPPRHGEGGRGRYPRAVAREPEQSDRHLRPGDRDRGAAPGGPRARAGRARRGV